MPEIPDAPPGYPAANPAAVERARSDGGLRARIARAIWTRDYQPGPEAQLGGFVYEIADRVASEIEGRPLPAAGPPKHIGNRANAEDCPAQPGDPGGPANTHPKETA